MNNSKKTSDEARERILGRLKSASKNNDGPAREESWSVRVFPQPEDLLKTFVEEFEKISGQVFVCENQDEIAETLERLREDKDWQNIFCIDEELKTLLPSHFPIIDKSDFLDVDISITTCEYLIARSGSIMVSSAHQSGRLATIFPPVHLVIASVNQLVPFLEDAIEGLKQKYSGNMPSQATVITGPSRTADIEKTLVMGAHGPKELILLIHK